MSSRSWPGSTQPAGAVVLSLAVIAGALAIELTTAISPITAVDFARAGVLTIAALIHTEVSRGIERSRSSADALSHIDPKATWVFPAALALPVVLSVAVVIVVCGHSWWRDHRHLAIPPVYRFATYRLASQTALLVTGMAGGTRTLLNHTPCPSNVILLVAAALAYQATNAALTAGAIATRRLSPTPVRAALGAPEDNAVQAAILCLGVAVAFAVVHQPPLVLVAVPLALISHRNLLIRQLRDQACADAKTGLLNAAAWSEQARHALKRAHGTHSTGSLVILDLDLFKNINDTFGHLVGDDVLRVLATVLRRATRAGDLVGRFGGDEFVILLNDTSGDDAFAFANRIRNLITDLAVPLGRPGDRRVAVQAITGITVSIGVARYPDHGRTLDQLLHAADIALYRAKNNGRDQAQKAGPFSLVPRIPADHHRAVALDDGTHVEVLVDPPRQLHGHNPRTSPPE